MKLEQISKIVIPTLFRAEHWITIELDSRAEEKSLTVWDPLGGAITLWKV